MTSAPLDRRSVLLSSLLVLSLLPSLVLASPRSPSGKNFTGENPLGVSRPEFAATQEGMDLIYQRRYLEALDHFEGMGFDFPDSPVGPVGRSLVYQAQMFENYDFSRERSYKTELADAQVRLKRALKSSPHPEWIWFLNAVHLGVDAIYDVRKKRYLPAFDKAWDALEEIKKVERGAPDFEDVDLALGLYNYWRTVITESVDVLPPFGDKRSQGLAQIRNARDNGLLAQAPASFALTFSLIEKGDFKAAVKEGERTQKEYPGSVLNQLILAQAYRRARKYPEALAILDSVRTKHPEIQRVWFHIGDVHYKSRRNNGKAREAFLRYLKSDPVDDYKAYTYYRLGQLERRARNYDEAIRYLEKAIDLQPKFKRAKKQLEDVKKAKGRKQVEPRKGSTARLKIGRTG